MSQDQTTADAHPEARPWLRITGPEDNGRGKLTGFDEIFAAGPVGVHIERMNSGHYWMRITGPDGQRQRIELWAKGGRLYSGTERE